MSIEPVITSSTVTFDPRFQEVLVFNKATHRGITVDKEYETALVWGNSALETFRNMSWHVAALRARYGTDHKWTIEAALSLAHVTNSLHHWGSLWISKDGPLSLFCRTRGENPFVFGIIFHGTHNKCVVDECPYYMGNAPYHYRPHDEVKVQLHKHQWLYEPGTVQPGTWSFHS